MRELSLLLALVGIAAGSPLKEGSGLAGRIVGGEFTSIRKVPYQVSIINRGEHHCGGTIISENWVLTAAHCMDEASRYFGVRAGSDDPTSGGSYHRVDRFVRHKGYDYSEDGLPMNDIALVHVVEPFISDETTQVIPLYDFKEYTKPGSLGVVSGWGYAGDDVSSAKLKRAVIPIISKAECRRAVAHHGRLPEGQICAGYELGGHDTCKGDSGGPLAVEGRLAGVISWGLGCAEARKPGIYSEVAYHREWIRSNSGV
ncbi:hypothetical protein KM043_001072 [Ampulex compressa]|nr:hypothetical protein KM043_001072 [Ampulex compressa]